jgi:hypothetical protein
MTDFTAHPYAGIFARQALEDLRFARAKDVTLSGSDWNKTDGPAEPVTIKPLPIAS